MNTSPDLIKQVRLALAIPRNSFIMVLYTVLSELGSYQ